MRDEKKFDKSWRRSRKVPKRIDSGSQSHVFPRIQDQYQKLYYEVIDQTLVSLNTRFQNDTMKLLNNFESYITGSAHVNISEITNFYNRDLDENEFDGPTLVNERDLLLKALNKDKTFIKKLKHLRKVITLKKQL